MLKQKKNHLNLFHKLLFSENFVLYLSITFFVFLIPIVPEISGYRNIINLSSNLWPLFILAVGQMFVLILGGIDLSQTSIMAVTSVIGTMLISESIDPALFENNPLWGTFLTAEGGLLSGNILATPLGIIVMLSVGVVIGLLNGIAIAKFKMPPFMVTLVGMILYSGLAIYLTQSENIVGLPKSFITIGKGKLGVLSYSMVVAIFFGIISHIILTRTVFGKWFYAIGKNIKTSVISGVPASRVIIMGYVISGFSAAMASVFYSARLMGGRPTLGQNQLLDIIGAVVIGGVSLFGGKGKVVWAFYGALFFTLLANALNMLNLSYFTINIVKGCVIIFAALLDVTRSRIILSGK